LTVLLLQSGPAKSPSAHPFVHFLPFSRTLPVFLFLAPLPSDVVLTPSSSQAQSLNIYFDTGSSDFTVSSSSCPSSSCGTKNRYTVASSSTAVKTSKTITTQFVDGSASSGLLVKDTVGITGVTATGQDIIAATSLSSTVADLESDGL
jgi:hypothetical protein